MAQEAHTERLGASTDDPDLAFTLVPLPDSADESAFAGVADDEVRVRLTVAPDGHVTIFLHSPRIALVNALLAGLPEDTTVLTEPCG